MIQFFDEDSLFNPSDLYKPLKDCPEVAIITWQNQFMTEANRYGKRQIGTLMGGMPVPLYKIESESKAFLIIHIPIGGPVVCQIISELKVLGVKQFVFIGSCGAIDESVKSCLIVPTKALRDEGTSYHYIESKDEFIDVETFRFTSDVLRKLDIPFVECPTWTTDCAYRETPSAIKYAKDRGCLCVEMECASIMAASKFEKIKSYQLLFSADSFSSDKWKVGRLRDMECSVYSAYLNIAIEIATKLI